MRVFITGANRGLGLAYTKEIIKVLKPKQLFATFRNENNSTDLFELAKQNSSVHLIQLDIHDDSKFDQVANTVKKATNDEGINVLINNAGVGSKYTKLSGVRKESLVENFLVNTIAPILLTKSFLPLLEKAADSCSSSDYGISRAAVINLTSILGSIEANNENGGMYPYRCSKAAQNAATRSMSIDFRNKKILAVAVHPGWVKTEMGGPKAPLTTEQSAKNFVTFLQSLNESHNGNFYEANGTKLNW